MRSVNFNIIHVTRGIGGKQTGILHETPVLSKEAAVSGNFILRLASVSSV